MLRKKNILLLLILMFVATGFLFLVSMSTSPLYKYWGYDSAIFMLVGKAIASGKMLYVDIFDHKGPIIFFIEAIGMSLGGIKGVFIMQIINLVISLFVLFKISELFLLSKKHSFILISVVLIFLSATFDDGNMTEEYSLPFLFLCLYLGVKYALQTDYNHPPKYSFVYGACMATLFLIRLTNSAAICGIAAAVFLILIIKKNWANLCSNIIAYIAGFSLVFGGVSLYFALNGAFAEMIYATFTFNFLYAKSVTGNVGVMNIKEVFKLLLIFMPFVLATIMSIIYYKKNGNIKLLVIGLFVSLATIITINIGLRTYHYITLNLIPLSLGMILYLKENGAWKKTYRYLSRSYILGLLLASIATTYNLVYVYDLSRNKELLYNNFSYVVDIPLVDQLIKADDRDSVFGYNLASNWYLATNILPPFKYYTNQESWSRSDRRIYKEINNYLETTPPKWIVIPKSHKVHNTLGIKGNEVLREILTNSYLWKGEDMNHTYYARKDLK